MHTHDQTCIRVHSTPVVFQVSTISRADFDHASARAGHHIRHTKVTANLHQLSTRNNRLSISRKHCQYQQRRRSTVVHDQCLLSPGDVLKQRLDSRCTPTTHTVLEVVFHRTVPSRFIHRCSRCFRQRCTA